mgnify:CR=1 FL=1
MLFSIMKIQLTETIHQKPIQYYHGCTHIILDCTGSPLDIPEEDSRVTRRMTTRKRLESQLEEVLVPQLFA